MNPFSQRQGVPQKLERSELMEASMWIAAKWFDRFVCGSDRPAGSPDLAEFGAFEANIAEAVVIDQGADFVFPKWGAALDTLCGGDRRGHRLSAFPQPSRGQLRRVCVQGYRGAGARSGAGDLGGGRPDLAVRDPGAADGGQRALRNTAPGRAAVRAASDVR